ncbi:MAG: fibrobacter succinogenes major paralogous domain-containing protein [Chitinophagales bacterium]|nr:fibrobacter succinogenes major paralogous domain-containing protein [Chitinophagales bacterium]MBP9548771.1 fibrobacter succinogenes major paralogous domain-containing protein [Chitinophagales bacterium]MBP9705363.1 fibrobacter succinogenes major paralogous domain-containing protein [Chitinophagales bacterium]
MKLSVIKILLVSITLTNFNSTYVQSQVIAQDGTTYLTVKINNQRWFAENLNVSTFRNGDPIPEAQTDSEWSKAAATESSAWCYYMNDNGKDTTVGKLYNWFAVNDPRGLAPEGWKIPSEQDFKTLIKNVGNSDAGEKMKSETGWLYDGNGSNSSGFNAKPGGYRYDDGSFNAIGIGGGWWSATSKDRYTAYFFYTYFNSNIVLSHNSAKDGGLSIRCIKEKL